MEYKDYYKIMGLARDASQDEIKRAWRKLARKYHPDVSSQSDAQERFQEMQEAYEVLKDPEKRSAYDQLGADWQAGQDFRPPPDWGGNAGVHGGFQDAGEAAFSDFFESLFGHRSGGARPAYRGGAGMRGRGQDQQARMQVDLEDAFQGATRSLALQVPVVDEQGQVRTQQRTLKVRIPRGIRPGQHIRLAGQGLPGAGGGPAGDLYLEVEFKAHRLYRIDGVDLYMDLPVAPWEAALGARVTVPTPAGVVDLSIPAGSGAGSRLRLRGRGLPAKTPGDLYVNLQIALPAVRDERARQLYEQMREQMNFNPRAALGV